MDIVDVSLPYWDPEYISFWWVGGPSNPDVMSVTFPDALEVPPEWVTEVPAKDMAFHLQLPIGWIAWQMVGRVLLRYRHDRRRSALFPRCCS